MKDSKVIVPVGYVAIPLESYEEMVSIIEKNAAQIDMLYKACAKERRHTIEKGYRIDSLYVDDIASIFDLGLPEIGESERDEGAME